MNFVPSKILLLLGACAGIATFANAQIVELRATINAAQETSGSTSPATGSAIMLYDVATNTFDLMVTVADLSNTIANSHIHEAASGTSGGVVAPLGAESAYTRSGTTVTASFHNLTYGGDPLKLLQGGAYYNVHSSQYPAGEIRGQLVPRPKRLVANLDVAQAQATSTKAINSNAYGAAVLSYDPATKMLMVRVNVYNLTNTFANSHIHEGVAGSSGGVVFPMGGAAAYAATGTGSYSGSFSATYGGDPIKLLTGGAYLNFHSNVYPAGEIRGQILPSEELPSSRVVNVSARGMVGTGDQVLIGGFRVTGPEPLRVLVSARGPSLAAYGINGAVADPAVALYDVAGRLIASNNDVGTPAAGSDLTLTPGVPHNATEAALLVVLPPGNYSAVVSANNGATGIGLLEVTDVRGVATDLTAQ